MKNNNLEKLRHSTAHLLAAAVLKIYPGTKLGIGPIVANGFYYDFDLPRKISVNDLSKLEQEIAKIATKKLDFEHFFYTDSGAKKWAKKTGQTYKLELIEELAKEGKKLSFYKTGDFVDLCEGPHIKNTKNIKHFKLLSVAGAYWKGSENNPQLTRIYGTAWYSQKALADYLVKLKEAKKRDHRKFGQELGLFILSEEVGPGLPLILPKGKIIINLLQDWARELQTQKGYQEVQTPHIGKKALWVKSGHWNLYRDSMFPPINIEAQKLLLKPMNCPFHYLIYQQTKRSYRELPLRIAEFGTVYRTEKSGELSGLLRIRSLTQDDAHIFLTEDQLVSEFDSLFSLLSTYFKTLGLKVEMTLSLWDEADKKKYMGSAATWNKTQRLLEDTLKTHKLPYQKVKGEAAFYGPKIDPIVRDSLGRSWQIATIQVDNVSAKRFNLTYTDPAGNLKNPIIIHRAPLGTFERTLGILIEHFAGAFPVWLAPVQVVVIPISDKNLKFAQSISEKLKERGIRAELDKRSETMQTKIRTATLQKIPYMVICGTKEETGKTIAVRTREGKDLGAMSLAKFLSLLNKKIVEKSL